MQKIIKSIVCAFVLITLFSSVVSASFIDVGMKKYDSANEKQFQALEKQTLKDFKTVSSYAINHKCWKVLVVSESANFENSNICFNYKIINSKKIQLKNASGKTEIVTFNELKKYECHFFNKTVPKKLDTSGSLNNNLEIIQHIQKVKESKK